MKKNKTNINLFSLSYHSLYTFLHFTNFRLLLIDGSAEQRENDTGLGVYTDCRDQYLAASLHYMRAGQDHWVVGFAFFHVIRFTRKR